MCSKFALHEIHNSIESTRMFHTDRIRVHDIPKRKNYISHENRSFRYLLGS